MTEFEFYKEKIEIKLKDKIKTKEVHTYKNRREKCQCLFKNKLIKQMEQMGQIVKQISSMRSKVIHIRSYIEFKKQAPNTKKNSEQYEPVLD